MHRAAFAAIGLPWRYELMDVEPEALQAAVESLRSQEVAGANVTIPHKVGTMAMLDDLDESARRVGAVNTIVNRVGRLEGLNTDVDGISAALAEVRFQPVAGQRAVVLGAGGSARAVGAALAGADLTFVARDPRRAEGLPGRAMPWPATDAGWRELAGAAALVVNATPLGRGGEQSLPENALSEGTAVIDLVYARGGTPLVRAARGRGLPCADGWLILLGQGAASFRAWTGLQPPVEAMRGALQS